MTRVHVAIGSNIDPQEHVPAVPQALAGPGTVTGRSRVYRTAAIDRPRQADYWNAMVVLETGLPPTRLREALRRVEAEHGRVRTRDRYAARTLDLDVLLWEGRPAGDEEARELDERPWLAWAWHDLGGPLPKTPCPAVVPGDPWQRA